MNRFFFFFDNTIYGSFAKIKRASLFVSGRKVNLRVEEERFSTPEEIL